MEAAVTRKDRDGNCIAAQQAISTTKALTAYTSSAACIGGSGDFGVLEVGKLADMILLAENPLTTAPDKLAKIAVDKTFVGGELVWNARGDGILTL